MNDRIEVDLSKLPNIIPPSIGEELVSRCFRKLNPVRHLLEEVEPGVYRCLRCREFELDTRGEVSTSWRPPANWSGPAVSCKAGLFPDGGHWSEAVDCKAVDGGP